MQTARLGPRASVMGWYFHWGGVLLRPASINDHNSLVNLFYIKNNQACRWQTKNNSSDQAISPGKRLNARSNIASIVTTMNLGNKIDETS